MPFNNYLDPWVNSLFQDAQPLAKGIFEGVAAQSVADVRALRVAELELSDSYDPQVHDKALSTLSWEGYRPDEMALLPTVLTIGGDGATYDIGFGAMSRILASDTPVKVLVLNSGVYSNTGGQASTASLTGQDSDLARFGSAHDGKHESRKELGLLASFHPNVYVCSTSTAHPGALPHQHDGVPEVPGRRGGARRLHAVRLRARHPGGGVVPAGPARGREPDEPGVRARPAPRLDPARLVQPRRQPGHRQDLGDHGPRLPRRRGRPAADAAAAHPGRVRAR